MSLYARRADAIGVAAGAEKRRILIDVKGGRASTAGQLCARVLGVPVLVAAITLTLPTASAASDPNVGLSPGYDVFLLPDQDLERELDLYQSLGIKWLRIDLNWAAIEGTQGQRDWGQPDRIVAAAHRRGLRVLAIPAYSPPWATRVPGVSNAPPRRLSDFTRFLTAAVKRYGPIGVRHWEIWNEPNLEVAWYPAPEPRLYARMLIKASRAIRRADPTAKVIAGNLGPALDVPNGKDVSPSRFTTLLYKYGADTSFDAISVHPYCFPALPSTPNTGDWNAFQRLPLVRQVMVRHGDASKKIWLTEFGAPTGTSAKSVSERRQARTYVEGIRGQKRWRWVGPLFLYSGRDRGVDPTKWGDNLGFVRADYTPKLAASTLEELLKPKPRRP